MPIYEVKCEKCGKEKEVLVLSIDEPLPICSCGGEYIKQMPSRVTWRWAYGEGVWEQEGSIQKYRGKGGKKQILGGEKLDIHEGLPIMAEEAVPNIQVDSGGDDLEEIE